MECARAQVSFVTFSHSLARSSRCVRAIDARSIAVALGFSKERSRTPRDETVSLTEGVEWFVRVV